MKRNILLFLAWMMVAISFAQTTTEEPVTFTKGQIATIILPITPDANKGRYYRLDSWENNQIVFEEEPHPKARTPYIIVPNEDFDIDLSTLDVTGLYYETVRIKTTSLLDPTLMVEIRFVGTYKRREIGFKDNGMIFYVLDTTSDCIYKPNGKASIIMGALRAYFEVSTDLCLNRDTMKYWDELEYVLHDTTTSIEKPAILSSKTKRPIYDLQGRRLSGKPVRGIYIEDGKKVLLK